MPCAKAILIKCSQGHFFLRLVIENSLCKRVYVSGKDIFFTVTIQESSS